MDGMISISGNIENNLKITFKETLEELARQKESYLSNIPAVVNAPFQGKVMAKVQYQEYLFDNRWTTKERWANAWIMDKTDLKDSITNPTSALYSAIHDALNNLKDRVIIKSAISSVVVGGRTEDDLKRIITAQEDGVRTIDTTSVYDFNTIKHVKRNFGNNYITKDITIVQTVNEEAKLLDDEKLINNYYSSTLSNRFNEDSLLQSLGCHFISNFTGSDNGTDGIGKKYNTMLPEVGGVRYCIALAEKAIQFGLVEIDIKTEELQDYVDSIGVKVVARAHVLRLQGEKIQIIQTTI